MNIQPHHPEVLERAARVRTQPPKGMLLHCGAELVDRLELSTVPTPPNTSSWYPLPHSRVLGEVEAQLVSCGFIITEQAHALTHDGARYFGVLNITLPGRGILEWSWAVAVRNSHDKTFPAGLVAGTKVFCCDNLAFCGEVQISRKHTRFAERDLRELTAWAIGKLGTRLAKLDERILCYNETLLTDRAAHDLVIRSLDCGIISSTQVPHVLKEWREPSHPEFRERTAWSLFNAFTEVHKGMNPHTVIQRGEALHGLFDQAAGVHGRN